MSIRVPLFSNQSMLGTIFAQIFREFQNVLRDFARFQRILPRFSPDENFWVCGCTPACYTSEMGSLAKDCFQPLVNKISTKMLEKQPTVFTQFYIDLQLQLKTQGFDSEIRIKYTFILTSCNVATMVTNKYKIFFSLTLTLCACAECIGA